MMRHILHVGPHKSRGGISKVMEILAENPPDGWSASILNTSSNGNIFSKLYRWFSAIREVKKTRVDVIHVHSAADWSFRRKLSLARKARCPVVFHIHSGNFSTQARKAMRPFHCVTLTQGWADRLRPLIGPSHVISNPVDPKVQPGDQREDFVLLLGRPDDVKGHEFAYSLHLPHLVVTGKDEAPQHVRALGWVSEEEKRTLLTTAKALIVPSQFEGQPLVILEALAANCPVVASDSIIDLPPTVVKAKHGDRQSWLDALDDLNTDGLIDSVSEHRIESIRKKWGRFYEDIISSNRSTE